jgi:response regulator RpfG family c-di-GMP phosphodiesterase
MRVVTFMLNILIVDDEPMMLEALRRVLRRSYAIAAAEDANEAFQLVDRQPPAAAIVDYRLSRESDGVSVLRRIRARYPSCLRILTGGYIEPDVALAAMLSGDAHVVLAKPWHRREVETLLGRLLEMRATA